MKSFILHFSMIIITAIMGCHSADDKQYLLELIPAEETGVHFENTIINDDSINLLTFEYLYNGGGVGIGDFNNDDLPDIIFSGSQVSNKIYLNKGEFVFSDITSTSGIDTSIRWSTGVNIIDINQDGWDDIYICRGGPGNKDAFPNHLYINNKDLTFTESAVEYGLDDTGESIQSIFFDYDLDGDLDMYLCTGGGFENTAIIARPIRQKRESRNTDRLYRNDFDPEKGHIYYQDVSQESGISIEGFGLGVNIIDANFDNWPDIYVSNDYISRDLLYINNQDGTFTDRSLQYFKHTSHFSMGNDVGDINNDKLPDIITVDMLPEDHLRKMQMSGPNQYDRFMLAVNRDYGYQYMRNMLHINHGNSGFSEVGQMYNIDRTDWSWGPLLFDIDLDGWQDLFISNGYGQDITDLDYVNFRNDAISPFSKEEDIKKTLIESLRSRPLIEIPNYVFQNVKGEGFDKKNGEWLKEVNSISNGASYADLDLDGDLDIVVNNVNQKAFLLRNNILESDTSMNYISIKLKGDKQNIDAYGTRVILYQKNNVQSRFHQSVHGFLSSSNTPVLFGLGSHSKIDSLEVFWPNGTRSIYDNLPFSASITLKYENSDDKKIKTDEPHPIFEDLQLIDYKHEESHYVDFKNHPLLLQGYSQLGPKIATADLNGDGADDFFIGGSYQFDGKLFISNAQGSYEVNTIPSSGHEDLGSVFFDLDNDGDLDIYVTSGGVEVNRPSYYQDRVYLNIGNGVFELSEMVVPDIQSSTSVVAYCDYDKDGDQDLFVGGRVDIKNYPRAPRSFLLNNHNGVLNDVTKKYLGLSHAGMITTAEWGDLDGDGWKDLIIAGEFMPLKVFKNNKGTLNEITYEVGLSDFSGWWNSIELVDIDNDGDLDILAGNIGINHDFNITPTTPMTVHYADFDNNGSIDPVFACYDQGKSYPIASLDVLSAQLPLVKKQFLHYRDYASVSTESFLKSFKRPYQTLQIKVDQSMVFLNDGDLHFTPKNLPFEAQKGPINDFAITDFNNDGFMDVIAVGNQYNTEVIRGRYDAMTGIILINDQKGNFEVLNTTSTGLFLQEEVNSIEFIIHPEYGKVLLAGINGGILKSLLVKEINNSQTSFKIESNISDNP